MTAAQRAGPITLAGQVAPIAVVLWLGALGRMGAEVVKR